MPIAAIPRYMRANEAAPASPALRFGPHLPIWTTRKDQNDEFTSRAGKHSREAEDLRKMREQMGVDAAVDTLVAQKNLPGLWTRNDAAARNAWRKVTKLTDEDRRRMNALAVRQSALRTSVAPPALLCLEARAIAPFTTGLGNEHPLENGFAFLNPYGLPYLPGSGVKGAVRRAAEELTHADFFGASGERTLPDVWRLFGFEPWPRPKDKVNRQSWKEWVDGFPVGKAEIDSYLDAALQYDPAAREKLRQRLDAQHDDVHRLLALLEDRTLHVRGALDFWDVIPKIAGDGLAVEIMTPHQSHYYQDNPHQGSTTPHDSGSPTPISFLTVPAESEFTFHIRCDVARLQRIAPRLARNGRWKHLVEAAFEHAFSWLGFGAKTAAGYGAMQRDRKREDRVRRDDADHARREQVERENRAQAERDAREREERLAALDPLDRDIQKMLDARPDKGVPEITAIIQAIKADRWNGTAKMEVAKRLKDRMAADKKWKETSRKKKPDRDKDYQNTLLVKRWLHGLDGE